MMYRSEVRLRTNILGEPASGHIRPLSETRYAFLRVSSVLFSNYWCENSAIENGANALAEGFLFSVAAALILGEGWRSSRSQSKRRDDVDDNLDALGTKLTELTTRVDTISTEWKDRLREEKERYVQ